MYITAFYWATKSVQLLNIIKDLMNIPKYKNFNAAGCDIYSVVLTTVIIQV